MKGIVMADGILCKHCGWQETDHDIAADAADNEREPEEAWKKKLRGFKKSLLDCPGYAPKNQRLAKKLAKEAEEREFVSEARRTHNFADN
jgi:hypothetical protein